MATSAESLPDPDLQGPTYTVVIDGAPHNWHQPTVTVPEIRTLGGILSGVEVIEVDLTDNTERTLAETEIVQLKPGLGFSKKVHFKRG